MGALMKINSSVIVPTIALVVVLAGAPTSVAHAVGSGAAITPYPQSQQATCDSTALSGDLGEQVQVLRCYPGWAYVTNGELGDSTSLVRTVGDSWTRYTGFPSSICKDRAAADGVPGSELSSFTSC